MTMASLPRLFATVFSVVHCAPDKLRSTSRRDRVQPIIEEVQKFRCQILPKHDEARDVDLELSPKQTSYADEVTWTEVLATTMSTIIMANRLLTALGHIDTKQLETQTLANAKALLRIGQKMMKQKGGASGLIRRKVAIGCTALDTAATWHAKSEEVIDSACFDIWCQALCEKHYAGPIPRAVDQE
jgi:hypothetical protein